MNPEKQKYTIDGGQIDDRLRGMAIDVKVAEINVDGGKRKVAVTCFENPHQATEVQSPGNFPECRRPIVNRVFILNGDDYNEADIIEVIQDEIVKEEAGENGPLY